MSHSGRSGRHSKSSKVKWTVPGILLIFCQNCAKLRLITLAVTQQSVPSTPRGRHQVNSRRTQGQATTSF